MTRDANHDTALELGGARRSSMLRVLPPEPLELPDDFELADGVPTRSLDGSCNNKVRPCQHVKCPRHLWMVDARDRPGRRYENGSGPRSELRIATLTTCDEDVIEHAKRTRGVRKGVLLTYGEIGELLGVSDERVRQDAQSALAKLKEHGVELDTFLAAYEAA